MKKSKKCVAVKNLKKCEEKKFDHSLSKCHNWELNVLLLWQTKTLVKKWSFLIASFKTKFGRFVWKYLISTFGSRTSHRLKWMIPWACTKNKRIKIYRSRIPMLGCLKVINIIFKHLKRFYLNRFSASSSNWYGEFSMNRMSKRWDISLLRFFTN